VALGCSTHFELLNGHTSIGRHRAASRGFAEFVHVPRSALGERNKRACERRAERRCLGRRRRRIYRYRKRRTHLHRARHASERGSDALAATGTKCANDGSPRRIPYELCIVPFAIAMLASSCLSVAFTASAPRPRRMRARPRWGHGPLAPRRATQARPSDSKRGHVFPLLRASAWLIRRIERPARGPNVKHRATASSGATSVQANTGMRTPRQDHRRSLQLAN